MSCIAHPYGRIARIFRRDPSFPPLVGAPPAPYQLLVHTLIGSSQLLPRFRGRRITESGIESSISMTMIFQDGVQHDEPVVPPTSSTRPRTARCVSTGAGRSAQGAGGATTSAKLIHRGSAQRAGRRGCTTFLFVSTVGYAIAAINRSYSLGVHGSSSST